MGVRNGMHRLSETDLLRIWERGQGRGPEEQALAPLAVAFADRPGEDLRKLPLGERDRRLLLLRRETLGPVLAAGAACPLCAAVVDFQVAVKDVLSAGETASGEHTLASEGFEVRFRLLDSRDLTFAAGAAGVAEARARLVERAVISATRAGAEVPAAELPAAVVAALAEALDARDPMAVIPLAVDCDRCDHRWLPLLDVAAFVWRELRTRAERVMYDVRELALIYGWSEAEALAVGPARRQFYIESAPAPGGGKSLA